MMEPAARMVRGFRGSCSRLLPRYSNAFPLSLDLWMKGRQKVRGVNEV